MKKYYTYVYLRKDKTPYYIGKGKLKNGRRYRLTADHGRIKIPSKERIVVLKEFDNENDAFKHEKYMIAIFGRKDLGTGILHNLTDGGEGSENVSQKTRKLISNYHKGKVLSEETKKKISDTRKKRKIKHLEETKRYFSVKYSGKGNPNYGKKHSAETLLKISEGTKNKNLKTRTYISPEGEIITATNLREFCEKNNLIYNSMISLHNEKMLYHKGYKKWNPKNNLERQNHWIGRKHSKETIQKQKEVKLKYRYELIDPFGNFYDVKFLFDFCLEYNLCETCIRRIANCENKKYKGWTSRKISLHSSKN